MQRLLGCFANNARDYSACWTFLSAASLDIDMSQINRRGVGVVDDDQSVRELLNTELAVSEVLEKPLSEEDLPDFVDRSCERTHAN
jgi:hypothetical protein